MSFKIINSLSKTLQSTNANLLQISVFEKHNRKLNILEDWRGIPFLAKKIPKFCVVDCKIGYQDQKTLENYKQPCLDESWSKALFQSNR